MRKILFHPSQILPLAIKLSAECFQKLCEGSKSIQMKYFILFLALYNSHLGYSQGKSPIDSSFELVVKYTHFQSPIASSSCWGAPVTLTGTLQNELDKTRLGQEVELVFTQNWMLADFSKSGQYKVKVRYYYSLITDNLQTKLDSPSQPSPKTKLLVLSTQPLSRAFQP